MTHQLGGTDYVPGSIYDATVAHSSRLLYAHADASGNCYAISTSKVPPTREELIQGIMSIPTYFPTIDARGWSVMGEPHWPTREYAEKCADAALGNHHEEQAAA